MTSLSLSGCSFLFNKNANPVNLDPTRFEKTYNDYMNHNFYQLDGTPLNGSPKLLVVPVWFTNSNTYIPETQKEKVREDINKCYFGTDKDVGWKSVKSYYYELSQKRLNLSGSVASWYECGKSANYFYSEDQGNKNTVELVKEIGAYYKTQMTAEQYREYDSDNNGYLDGVILIYGAPDYGALKNNNASNLWAYCFWTQVERGTIDNPVPNAFFWASYDFIYGDNTKVGNYASGDTSHCSLDTHTFIHEMGHMLGLEDYYDYSNQYIPSGGFSMQDYNVGSHDPYSVMAFGWANPMIPKESCTLRLRSFQETHDLILLTNHSSISSPFDEYLLLELYTPSGLNSFDTNYKYANAYPTGPKIPGIRLWHVDARLLKIETRSDDARVSFAYDIDSRYFYRHAMSNTYYSEEHLDYVSPLGKEYADYNILQLIRNSSKETYHPEYALSEYDLFTNGDTFKIKTFKGQFVNGEKLNDGSSLGWSFKVNKLNSSEAIVTVTKG